MLRLLTIMIFGLSVLPFKAAVAQEISFSDIDREDNRDINFDIIGKMNSNYLVYINLRAKHKIQIYGSDMRTIETRRLDFVPNNTFNIDFVAYPDYFLMIYQYQKGSILHCMAVKMDAEAKMLSEPVELDTTRIPLMSNNKIYSTIFSEDRQRIMIFKVQARNQLFNMATLLFDKDMNLLKRSRYLSEYNERRENYSNFLLGNDGTLLFSCTKQKANRVFSDRLQLLTKKANEDTLRILDVDLQEKYIDDVKLKIDNRNNRYLATSFYYPKSYGSVDGFVSFVFDRTTDSTFASQFVELGDQIRYEAKSTGMLRFAIDNFFIKQVIVKGDGSFILITEDYSRESRGYNIFNRFDYLYNPFLSGNSFWYNPYTGYYRPLSSYGNRDTRYYYENIMVFSLDKMGKLEWSKIIPKSQFEDNDENALSFATMISGGEVHFLYNINRKYQIIDNKGLTPDGKLNRYPTIRSDQRGYEFMPSLSKQVGAYELIMPCIYRSFVCFAKIQF